MRLLHLGSAENNRNKVFRSKQDLNKVPLLHLVIKMPQNGRNKVFRGKQAPNKVPLLCFDVNIFEESFDRRF